MNLQEISSGNLVKVYFLFSVFFYLENLIYLLVCICICLLFVTSIKILKHEIDCGIKIVPCDLSQSEAGRKYLGSKCAGDTTHLECSPSRQQL